MEVGGKQPNALPEMAWHVSPDGQLVSAVPVHDFVQIDPLPPVGVEQDSPETQSLGIRQPDPCTPVPAACFG